MKKILLSAVVLVVLGTSTIHAESYPAEGTNSYKALHEEGGNAEAGNFYAGIGYSYVKTDMDIPRYYFGNSISAEIQSDNINLIVGYDFNRYFALEARYTTAITDLDFSIESGYQSEGLEWGGDISNLGLYLKPKYQVGDATLYALLGYGHVRIDIDNIGDSSENRLQWGAGFSMDVGNSIIAGTESVVFLDYIRFYDKERSQIDFTIDSISAGIMFKF